MEFKRFTVLDGVGTAMARAADLKIALISGRYSEATEHRAKELKIEDVYNGSLNKIPAYEELKEKYNLDDSEIAYIGDDLIDIPIMEKVAVPIAVENAIQAVKDIAIYTTKVSGGKGAFREAVAWIIEEKGESEIVLQRMKDRIKNS
jgi:3-deoxy-D-manno-octulosonate 8-phosphate phosphatase (KDO 8-P phosphatase)